LVAAAKPIALAQNVRTSIFDPAHVEPRLRLASELIDVGGSGRYPGAAGDRSRPTGRFDRLGLARVDEARKDRASAAALVVDLGQPMQRYFVVWLESTLALWRRLDDAEGLWKEADQFGIAANHRGRGTRASVG
jgi:hypothetical protein